MGSRNIYETPGRVRSRGDPTRSWSSALLSLFLLMGPAFRPESRSHLRIQPAKKDRPLKSSPRDLSPDRVRPPVLSRAWSLVNVGCITAIFVWLYVATPLESNTQQRCADSGYRKHVTPGPSPQPWNANIDLFSDPSYMSQPAIVTGKYGESPVFQYFGSTFGSSRAVVASGKSCKDRSKPTENLLANSWWKASRISEDESDDKLSLSWHIQSRAR